MKKLSFSLLLMLGIFATIFISCDDEDDGPDIAPPVFTSDPDDATVEVGATTVLSFTATTPGGYQSSSVASSDGDIATATITSAPTSGTDSQGTFEVTVTGVAAGEATITLTVTDNQAQSANNDVVITVEEGGAMGGIQNIGDTIPNIEGLSTLAAALEATDLDEALNADGPFTVFAPNNDAITALLEALELNDLPAVINALGEEGVSQMLQAHVVSDDSLGAAELTDGMELTTINDSTITVTNDGTNVFVNGAQVLTADIVAGNGVIHIIDSVINLPPVEGGEPTAIDPTQAPRESLEAYLGSEFTGNAIVDPGLGGVASSAGGLDPIPSAAAVTNNIAPYPDGDFFTEVAYKGAFDPSAGTTWLDGWSLLSQSGYLATGTAQNDGAAYDPATATIVDVTSPVTGDVTWTADNVYRIDGYTFVQDGTLTIEAGTVVIATAKTDENDDASALIITQSAAISAEGTADNPIIFTSELDDGSLLPTDAGQWGGLVILGSAPAEAGGATTNIEIEGIPAEAGDITYGGGDAADNSGTLRYVSIRHTGDILGNGDEVQGLTLGGVGSGTTIEYVESIASADDGVEIFGGTVNIKYFAVAYQEDDAFDVDQGWMGNGQFLFSLALPSDLEGTDVRSDHAGEWDGFDEGNSATALTSNFTIYNATFVGAGQGSSRSTSAPAILVRENAAATVANSIITNFNGKAINVEDVAGTDEGDSFARFQNGEIDLIGNIYYVNPNYTDFSSGETGIVVGGE